MLYHKAYLTVNIINKKLCKSFRVVLRHLMSATFKHMEHWLPTQQKFGFWNYGFRAPRIHPVTVPKNDRNWKWNVFTWKSFISSEWLVRMKPGVKLLEKRVFCCTLSCENLVQVFNQAFSLDVSFTRLVFINVLGYHVTGLFYSYFAHDGERREKAPSLFWDSCCPFGRATSVSKSHLWHIDELRRFCFKTEWGK